MKLGKKLLPFALFLALPLAACNFNVMGGGNGQGGNNSGDNGGGNGGNHDDDEGGGSEGGGDDVLLSAKVEAQRIASEVFDIDVNDVVFADIDEIDEDTEYDVGSYETSKLTFYAVQYEDEELDYEGIVSDVKSYLPEGAKKDSSHSIGEEDYSDFLEEGSWINLQEFYTKENLAYDVLVSYMEAEGESFSYAGIAVFEKSELNEYMKYMEYTEDDDDDDDDDDDEEGAGQTFDYSEVSSPVATLGDFTVDCHKVGGEAAPVIQNGEELRMYAGNELTISSKGDAITSIDFYNCDCTSKVGATFAAKSGTLTTTSYGYHWEGNATSVTFTCTKVDDSHKQVHFFAIEINGGESGEGGGGGTVVSSGNAEEFAKAIAEAIFGSSVVDEDYYDWEDGSYSVYVASSEYTEDELDEFVEDLVGYLSTVGLYIDGEVEAYDDSDNSGLVGYEAYLYDEDETIEVNIYSYLYDEDVCASIDIYPVEY